MRCGLPRLHSFKLEEIKFDSRIDAQVQAAHDNTCWLMAISDDFSADDAPVLSLPHHLSKLCLSKL